MNNEDSVPFGIRMQQQELLIRELISCLSEFYGYAMRNSLPIGSSMGRAREALDRATKP